MDILSKFITPGILFILTVLFGFWLSRIGKPYNGALFNVHKLIALAAVILAAMQVFNLIKETNIVIVLFAVMGLCAVALFASGVFMSLEKLDYNVVLTVHRVAPILAVISMGLAIYLLLTGKK